MPRPLYLLVVALGCAGCVPVTEPVGDIEKAEPDKALVELTEYWFFTATVGKHRYMNLIFNRGELAVPNFGKEGGFAEWKKGRKAYWVCLYSLDGDELRVDIGNEDAVKKVMGDEKWANIGQKDYLRLYETPAGGLAKYLDKNGPDKLFDSTARLELKRKKK
jgi:hypothetical protein